MTSLSVTEQNRYSQQIVGAVYGKVYWHQSHKGAVYGESYWHQRHKGSVYGEGYRHQSHKSVEAMNALPPMEDLEESSPGYRHQRTSALLTGHEQQNKDRTKRIVGWNFQSLHYFPISQMTN